jgi:hypothetical protein
MTDFAANIHFRTLVGSAARLDGFKGGYGWFFGRCADWSEFELAIRKELTDLGYDFLECDQLIEIASHEDLNEGEQQELFFALDDAPLQYRTIHLYREDDG